MLPIAIVGSTTPVPVPIVNTTLPGSAITHVPYDNVAPSISSAQVNNNASPNSVASTTSDQSEITQAEADTTEEQTSSALATNAAQNQSISAQATFLAQLISQDGSPVAQVILVQYEKLIALGLTKYKPSNAFKPLPAPANAFGQLLQQTKPAMVQSTTAPQATARQQAPISSMSEEEAALSSPAIAVAASRPTTPARYSTASANSNPATNSATQITNAYTQTASRVTDQELENTMELA